MLSTLPHYHPQEFASPLPPLHIINANSAVSTGLRDERFCAILPLAPAGPPRPYRPGLTPISSPLRPHCSARDRLRLWLPSKTRSASDEQGKSLVITEDDLLRVLAVMNLSWADSTRDMYGSGLLVYHVFCETREIPEEQRCPADTRTILAFIASCAGSYAGRTLSNYVYAVRAWHTLHGQPWVVQQSELQAALDGAVTLTPLSSKKPKREPITIHLIISIGSHLISDSPLDAAIFACLTSVFYALARLGEFTVPALKVFDPAKHVKHLDLSFDAEDRHGLRVSKIRLPRTKSSDVGEDVYWAQQDNLSDLKQAML